MSSLPGLTLEDYLMWNFNLIVDDAIYANESLRIAELLGVKTNRQTITKIQFEPIVSLYKNYREQVEYGLSEFDEDTQSWRDYAGYVFDYIPNELHTMALNILKEVVK